MKQKHNSPWIILGIDPESDMPAVKRAYKLLSKIHHPDKGGKVADWLKISEAYETIKSNNYIPILQSDNTKLLNLKLTIKQQILGLDGIIVVEDAGNELFVNLTIPPGAVAGDKFNVIDNGQKYIINIKDQAHKVFTRQGNSLIMYKKVSIVDALKRTPIFIEGPAEEFIEVDLPDDIQSGTILTLPHSGLFNRKTRKRGSLRIHLHFDLPVLNEHNIEDFITRLKND